MSTLVALGCGSSTLFTLRSYKWQVQPAPSLAAFAISSDHSTTEHTPYFTVQWCVSAYLGRGDYQVALTRASTTPISRTASVSRHRGTAAPHKRLVGSTLALGIKPDIGWMDKVVGG